MSESALIEAVQTDRVGSVAAADGSADGAVVLEACAAIAARLSTVRSEVEATLAQAGIDASVEPIRPHPQRYAIEVSVADLATADAIGDALAPAGFERWERWTGGARRSFERYGDHLSFARTDDVTTVVRVRWRPGTTRSVIERILYPTPGDWHAMALPAWAWWAYPIVRVGRLAVERIVPSRRYAGSLGPFLSTPDSLLGPLLDLVAVGDGSRVADLGCGDGRLVVAAAARGASAVGVERDPELVRQARARAVEHGVADRTTFVVGDARTADLGDIDVVFAFLPVEVIAELLPSILATLQPGATVLVHEQNRLPSTVSPSPDASDLVVGPDAMTVAHRWHVRAESA